MRESVLEGRGRWTVAAGGALVVMTAVLLLFRLPAPPTPLSVPKLPSPAKATVKMAPPDGSDVLLREEAQLRDLRPLFLPTERNAALPEPRLEPGRTFLDNETLKLALGILEGVSPADWTADKLTEPLKGAAEAKSLKLGDLMQPIRVALTGSTVSEPVNELLAVVGRDAALAAIKKASA